MREGVLSPGIRARPSVGCIPFMTVDRRSKGWRRKGGNVIRLETTRFIRNGATSRPVEDAGHGYGHRRTSLPAFSREEEGGGETCGLMGLILYVGRWTDLI